MKFFWSKEVKIGLLFILSVGMFVFGLNYLKGVNLLEPTNFYYLSLPNTEGLNVSAPVTINGHKVGLVREISFDYKGFTNTVVLIGVDKALKIPRNSHIQITSSLMGEPSLEIIPDGSTAGACYDRGDTIRYNKAYGLMEQLQTEMLPKAMQILPKVDSILTGINQIVNNPTLGKSLSHIEATTQELASSSRQLAILMDKQIPQSLTSLQSTLSNFEGISSDLKKVNIPLMADQIDLTLRNLNQTTKQLNSPDNTLGLLLNDRALYDSLNTTVGSANTLLIDLKQNPKRYVHFSIWGKK